MKIMMLCPAYSIHSIKWVNSLAERGYEIHVCFCKNQGDKAGITNDAVIKHELPFSAPIGYYLNAVNLRKITQQIKPDIIHVHRASSYGTLARIARIQCNVLSIWGSDVYEFPFKSKSNRNIVKKNLAYANCLASTSGVMAEQSRQFLKDSEKKIFVTPFGVDITRFIGGSKKEKTSITIGTVKTLSPKYGISDAINSINILLNKLRDTGYIDIANAIRYDIYGKGPLKDKLQSQINNLGLEKVVNLLGYIQNLDVPEKLRNFDIFLASSTLSSESFGVAVVEAMACELPIVATKVPGFTEVVADCETGFLVNIKDPLAISEALYKLIINKELREKMGKKGRERVLTLYNWEDNVTYMEKIYVESLKK